ncbi:Clavaminate synthase-like protein [Testicularia cyperi]|uniref:Clavaminate synthase-like protein n=1 Tax=Testicularia cyperi TaxID=1882483 RepID=A0A317Y0S4_9BASI|nr:Clavaminate synthase-like protein [Testicularia cyperi]
MTIANGHPTNGSEPASLASLPEYHLDYSLWQPDTPTSAASQEFVSRLRQAMTGIGFFYLHNTPLDAKRDAMFDLVERIFALPLETRLSINMDNSRHFRGYCKFGDERTQSQVDFRDQIDYAVETKAVEDRSLTEKLPFLNLLGPNQFLDDSVCKGHKSIVIDWFNACSSISDQLTRAIELALGVGEGELSRFQTGQGGHNDPDPELAKLGPLPYARMKTIRYPAGAVVDGIARDSKSSQGVGAHKDSGWLTLLSPSQVAGLQVQDFDGTWIDVPYLPGGLIVNFGQQVENLTQGIVQAATHRVLTPPDATQTRYSVAWFSSPALNTYLSPLDKNSFDAETRRLHEQAIQRRANAQIKSDVAKGDLYARAEEPFGWINWRGLFRSHPGVVNAFYPHLV